MKSILEVMYSGETIISEEYIKYFVAVTKLLQMDWIRDLFADYVGLSLKHHFLSPVSLKAVFQPKK